MRRVLLLVPLLVLLLMPTALALDQEEIWEEQTQALGLDELEQAGEAYTGQTEIGEDLDVAQSFHHMAQTGKEALGGVVKASVRSCVLLLAVTLLCGLAEGLQVGGTDRLGAVTLVGALVITTIAVGDVNSLLAQGKQAISNMEALGDVLLPTVSMATAASGAPAMAVVKHSITILFSDLLLHLIQNLLIPLCYAYVAANVAWAALGNDGLKRIGGLLKWLITILLSVVLLAFIAYLNLSGVISGGADAATVKAAKFTISNLVPVVGGVISDTAETLLAGASVLRNAAGVFGMLAVLGICVVPFLNLGVHYLMYKCTAALAATASGNGRITGLIEALGTAFGLILAMTAACAVLLVVAMVSAVSAVTGEEGRHVELIRTWILSVTVSAIVIAVAEALMPPGAVKKVGKLTGGLILVLGILQPLVTMDYEDLYDMVTALPAGAIAQEEAQTHQYEAMKGIIEEELEAYIVDKGEALGADCTAQVTCTPGEGEVPVPTQATVTGDLTPAQQEAMSRYLEQELGIPSQGQIFDSEEVP